MTDTDLTLHDFDYAALAADVAVEMRARASRICEIRRASVLEVGRELIEAKKQVEHGCFVAWVRTACQMNIRTAERAMRAAELVEKNDKLSYLPPDGLLALASRSAPQSVVNEVMGEIAAGETPSAAGIKRRIADGCPITNDPNEHFVITEKLLSFRAAARKAAEAERQRFLHLSASL